jgi:hypothetical protein
MRVEFRGKPDLPVGFVDENDLFLIVVHSARPRRYQPRL